MFIKEKTMRKVLVLCTGNSCRSIMAEALINHHLGDAWTAFSAGVQPSSINPRAVQVMQEVGIDLSKYHSKSVSEFLTRDDLDLVITVCDHAKETCPMFFQPVRQIHIGFEDPAPYTDARDELALPKFREVRDQIKAEVINLLKGI
jgi:arsenate reductase (thioredoxin)